MAEGAVVPEVHRAQVAHVPTQQSALQIQCVHGRQAPSQPQLQPSSPERSVGAMQPALQAALHTHVTPSL